MGTKQISVVVPVLDEEGTLKQLHQELDAVASANDCSLQVIFVDDGSTDRSWREIISLAATDSRVEGIRLRRNFGKAAALSAGFDAVQGDVIVMMDADLQDSPAELPRMLARLEEGDVDLVSGWKRTRHDPWHKRWPSKGFNALVGWLTGVKLHDHNCGFKCFRRELVDEIRLYGELHRFVPVLAAARGFRVDEIVVEHRPRTQGRSKYGWTRIPKGLLDLFTIHFMTRFSQRPQHWLGSAGLMSLLMGIACMFYLALVWFASRMPGATPVHLHQTAALYYSMVLTVMGSQLLATGFVAEMIADINSRQRDAFSISERTGNRSRDDSPRIVTDAPARRSA